MGASADRVSRHQENVLPFNLRNIRAVLRGRLDYREAVLRARMLWEDIPLLTGGRLPLRYLDQGEMQIWPYYVFTNYRTPPDDRNPALLLRHKAAGYGLNWGDLVTLSKVIKFARQQWGEHWVRPFWGANEAFSKSSFHGGRTVVAEPVESATACTT